jgi:hypothetical protein
MKCNVGGTERSIRIGAGLLALGIGLFAGVSAAMAWAILAVGAILLLTGSVGFCPLFTLLGVNTCSGTSDTKR